LKKPDVVLVRVSRNCSQRKDSINWIERFFIQLERNSYGNGTSTERHISCFQKKNSWVVTLNLKQCSKWFFFFPWNKISSIVQKNWTCSPFSIMSGTAHA